MATDRSDRRVLLIALGVMIGMVLFGVGFGAFFAATQCRSLEPVATAVPVVVTAAADGEDAITAALVDAGVATDVIERLRAGLGGPDVLARLPFDAAQRLGEHPEGVLVTGDGLLLVGADGTPHDGVGFRRDVAVIGDGITVYAVVVGNRLTGQVDALRPLTTSSAGIGPGTCVDTSAVGSPLSFVHDAREGLLLGLRTDEDGSDVVLELRDAMRGRVWAPVVELPRAPAGLQGSRTSGAIGPDVVVMSRRIAPSDGTQPAVRAFARSDGSDRWSLSAPELRALLPEGSGVATADTLRIAVAHVGAEEVVLTVAADVPVDAALPAPTYGPLGGLSALPADVVTVVLAVADGRHVRSDVGAPSIDRDGGARDTVRATVAAAGLAVDDVLSLHGDVWLLFDGLLLRFRS